MLPKLRPTQDEAAATIRRFLRGPVQAANRFAMRELRSYMDEIVGLCRAHAQDGACKKVLMTELENRISKASCARSRRWAAMRLFILVRLVSRLPCDTGNPPRDKCSLDNIGRSIMLSSKYYDHTGGAMGIADHRLIRTCRCLLKCLNNITHMMLERMVPFPCAFAASHVMGNTLDRLLQDFNRLIWYKHSVLQAVHTARTARRYHPSLRKGKSSGTARMCKCCSKKHDKLFPATDPLFQEWLASRIPPRCHSPG